MSIQPYGGIKCTEVYGCFKDMLEFVGGVWAEHI